MDIIKYEVYRGPNIGIYTKVTDRHIFIPNGFATTKAKKLASYLGTNYVFTSVANTRLLGTMISLNNRCILLPRTAHQVEFDHLKESTDIDVKVLNTKYTALGNLICANDKGAIVSPLLSSDTVLEIQDHLGVETVQKKIAGYVQVGAMAVANSTGGVIHPETDEEDIKVFSNVLGVNLEPATVNGGIPFISSGILANNNSVVVGAMTSGPEIMMLTRAFLNQ